MDQFFRKAMSGRLGRIFSLSTAVFVWLIALQDKPTESDSCGPECGNIAGQHMASVFLSVLRWLGHA